MPVSYEDALARLRMGRPQTHVETPPEQQGARKKGLGYFGELQRPGGGVSSELSFGVPIQGKETEIPALVPTLSREEIDYLLGGGKITDPIMHKAVAHAQKRIAQGKDPFAQAGEQTPLDKPKAKSFEDAMSILRQGRPEGWGEPEVPEPEDTKPEEGRLQKFLGPFKEEFPRITETAEAFAGAAPQFLKDIVGQAGEDTTQLGGLGKYEPDVRAMAGMAGEGLEKIKPAIETLGKPGALQRGIGEAAAQTATALGGEALGGIAGLLGAIPWAAPSAGIPIPGREEAEGLPFMETLGKVREGVTYQPRTEEGKIISEAMAKPFEALIGEEGLTAKGAEAIAPTTGETIAGIPDWMLTGGLKTIGDVGLLSLLGRFGRGKRPPTRPTGPVERPALPPVKRTALPEAAVKKRALPPAKELPTGMEVYPRGPMAPELPARGKVGRGEVLFEKPKEAKVVHPKGYTPEQLKVQEALETPGFKRSAEQKLVVDDPTSGTRYYSGIPYGPDEVRGWAGKVKDHVGKVLDVEYPFRRMGAPDTGHHVKTYYSKIEALREKWGDQKVKELSRKKLTPEQYGEIALEAQKKGTKNPEALKAQKYFDDTFKELNKRDGLQKPWPHNIIDQSVDRITQIKDILKTVKNKKARQEYIDEIKTLEKAVSRLKDTSFVHIPTRLWFEDLLAKNPKQFGELYGKMRILAQQKRKTISIQDLVDNGLIKKSQIDIRDIMGNYAARYARDIAQLDIINALKKEKLARLEPGEGFIQMPGWKYPALKKFYVHPRAAELLDNFFSSIGKQGAAENVLGSIKMLQFYNPLFLPMYDVVQAGMHGTLNPLRPIKSGKNVANGINSMIKKDAHYWNALEEGLSSKPMINPYKSYQQTLTDIKNSGGSNVVRAIKNTFKPNVIKTIYNASWDIAWTLDQTVRMMSYHHNISKGYSPRQAARLAAEFHADYAKVPPATRKALNHIFFTPTFKITMGNLHKNMLASVGKKGLNIASLGKYKVDALTNRRAAGAAATAAIVLGYHTWMKANGFDTEHFGWKYKKTLDTPDGPKELIIGFSNPANMFMKYLYRWQDTHQPGVENPDLEFLQRNKWELHPVYQIAYDIANNRGMDYGAIYEPYEDDERIWAKKIIYAGKRILRISSLLDASDEKQETKDQVKKELGQLQELIFRPFTYSYLRPPEQQRKLSKARKAQKMFIDSYKRQEGKIDPRQIQNYMKQAREIIEE